MMTNKNAPGFFKGGTPGNPISNTDIHVVSGVVSGDDIILTLSDTSKVTIDASGLGGEIETLSFNEANNTLTIVQGDNTKSVVIDIGGHRNVTGVITIDNSDAASFSSAAYDNTSITLNASGALEVNEDNIASRNYVRDNTLEEASVSDNVLTITRGDGTTIVFTTHDGVVSTDSTLTGDGSSDTPLSIADDGVSTAKVADAAITEDKLANNAVTGDKISNDTIPVGKLNATGTASASTYLRGDNTWATVSGGGSGTDTNLPDVDTDAAQGESKRYILEVTGEPNETTYVLTNPQTDNGNGFDADGFGLPTASQFQFRDSADTIIQDWTNVTKIMFANNDDDASFKSQIDSDTGFIYFIGDNTDNTVANHYVLFEVTARTDTDVSVSLLASSTEQDFPLTTTGNVISVQFNTDASEINGVAHETQYDITWEGANTEYSNLFPQNSPFLTRLASGSSVGKTDFIFATSNNRLTWHQDDNPSVLKTAEVGFEFTVKWWQDGNKDSEQSGVYQISTADFSSNDSFGLVVLAFQSGTDVLDRSGSNVTDSNDVYIFAQTMNQSHQYWFNGFDSGYVQAPDSENRAVTSFLRGDGSFGPPDSEIWATVSRLRDDEESIQQIINGTFTVFDSDVQAAGNQPQTPAQLNNEFYVTSQTINGQNLYKLHIDGPTIDSEAYAGIAKKTTYLKLECITAGANVAVGDEAIYKVFDEPVFTPNDAVLIFNVENQKLLVDSGVDILGRMATNDDTDFTVDISLYIQNAGTYNHVYDGTPGLVPAYTDTDGEESGKALFADAKWRKVIQELPPRIYYQDNDSEHHVITYIENDGDDIILHTPSKDITDQINTIDKGSDQIDFGFAGNVANFPIDTDTEFVAVFKSGTVTFTNATAPTRGYDDLNNETVFEFPSSGYTVKGTVANDFHHDYSFVGVAEAKLTWVDKSYVDEIRNISNFNVWHNVTPNNGTFTYDQQAQLGPETNGQGTFFLRQPSSAFYGGKYELVISTKDSAATDWDHADRTALITRGTNFRITKNDTEFYCITTGGFYQSEPGNESYDALGFNVLHIRDSDGTLRDDPSDGPVANGLVDDTTTITVELEEHAAPPGVYVRDGKVDGDSEHLAYTIIANTNDITFRTDDADIVAVIRDTDTYVGASISGSVITFEKIDGDSDTITVPSGGGGSSPSHTILAGSGITVTADGDDTDTIAVTAQLTVEDGSNDTDIQWAATYDGNNHLFVDTTAARFAFTSPITGTEFIQASGNTITAISVDNGTHDGATFGSLFGTVGVLQVNTANGNAVLDLPTMANVAGVTTDDGEGGSETSWSISASAVISSTLGGSNHGDNITSYSRSRENLTGVTLESMVNDAEATLELYDSLLKTYRTQPTFTNGLPTSVQYTKTDRTSYFKSITFTNGLPTQVQLYTGTSAIAANRVYNKTITFTNGLPTDVQITFD